MSADKKKYIFETVKGICGSDAPRIFQPLTKHSVTT